MKIQAIEAKNFRTLEDFSIHFSENYCALSGKNNAGKSTLVKIIQHFFDSGDEYRFFASQSSITYQNDCTQWKECDELSFCVDVKLDQSDDSEIYYFLEKFSDKKLTPGSAVVRLRQIYHKDGSDRAECTIDGHEIDPQGAREIQKKFRSSSTLVLHNSTRNERSIFYAGGAYAEVLEATFSADDRKKIGEAQTRLQNSVKRAAKQHKEELDKLLGRLSDKFQVELSALSGGESNAKFPLSIKLTDKRVDISLSNWGAGTQNRTRIIISILEAIRMRSSESQENRLTPLFIVEEPESFLHPSAQAEFGQMLNSIAVELNLQIIATTHSPYMLNQSDPSANYLLERKVSRGSPKETAIVPTTGDNWMAPFAENLGIVPKEFSSWSSLFGTQASKVVLVEGEIDKQYFEHIRDNYPDVYQVPSDVEIVQYGGKDALKNTHILQFMIKRFSRVYITFDLDAKTEVFSSLTRLGLVEDKDFCAIGVQQAGSECIEGLVPPSIKQAVFAADYETVIALSSQDTNARRSAKSKIKQRFLEEFKKKKFPSKDLADFKKLFTKISKEVS
jgi:predicted ATP-binding protein involved in virulence